jgi:hypothetical protein
MTVKPSYEAQLSAMRTVMEALEPLDETGRETVLSWASSQLGVQRAAPSLSPGSPSVGPSRFGREGTVSMVAQKLGVKSARELLLAAATHLTLYQGKDSFTKDELVACAKEARAWKANYSSQIAVNIGRMSEADVLFEKARDVFSLSDTALNNLEERLSR